MTVSILEFVPADFVVFVGLLVFAIIAAAGWVFERERRLRLLEATKKLERIQHLTAIALREHSPDKVRLVNEMIGTWDEAFTEEVGEPVEKLESDPGK